MATTPSLLDLPAEIQEMIYYHALSSHRIKIRTLSDCPEAISAAGANLSMTDVVTNPRARLPATAGSNATLPRPWDQCDRCDNEVPPSNVEKRCWKCAKSARGLLYTCRSIYEACVKINFEKTTVAFVGTHTSPAFRGALDALSHTSFALRTFGYPNVLQNIELHLARQPCQELERFADGGVHNAFPNLRSLKIVMPAWDICTIEMLATHNIPHLRFYWWFSYMAHEKLILEHLVRVTQGCDKDLKLEIVGDFEPNAITHMLEVLRGGQGMPENYDWKAAEDIAFEAWLQAAD